MSVLTLRRVEPALGVELEAVIVECPGHGRLRLDLGELVPNGLEILEQRAAKSLALLDVCPGPLERRLQDAQNGVGGAQQIGLRAPCTFSAR